MDTTTNKTTIMETNELHLRIISPSHIEYEGDVTMVVLPGAEGNFGVLAKHMPMVAHLRNGKIEIYKDTACIKIVDIHSGVASVTSTGVDVLLSEF